MRCLQASQRFASSKRKSYIIHETRYGVYLYIGSWIFEYGHASAWDELWYREHINTRKHPLQVHTARLEARSRISNWQSISTDDSHATHLSQVRQMKHQQYYHVQRTRSDWIYQFLLSSESTAHGNTPSSSINPKSSIAVPPTRIPLRTISHNYRQEVLPSHPHYKSRT